VAAGSEVDDRPYTAIHDRPPIELPGWLARRLTPPAPAPGATPGADLAPKGRGYAASALAGEVARVLDAPAGQRNSALNRAAWNLARHIATGLVSRELVEHSLTEVGIAAGGQTPAGVAATIRCAIEARLGRGGAR
jgi:hypothetical protein